MKIGSALIGDPETGEIRGSWLETLIEDVVRFFARGQQVIIVTSGVVAVGSSHFNHLDRSLRVEEKQTAAAIGQVQFMRAYEQSLKRHSFGVGQILLTREDIDDQHRRLNAVSTLQRLLKVGAPYPLSTRTTRPQRRSHALGRPGAGPNPGAWKVACAATFSPPSYEQD
ncbi:hypothetical protein NKJ06_26555 [Mesorhizobium sp. M0293]|uniref:amino acid kinase family protein n=1 Tax=Mesorhizobium sp. M0293 TaxID=2956930 RepID=UPI00333CB0E8